MSNQEGKVYRLIDESQNTPRKAHRSVEVDGDVTPPKNNKYRIGIARGRGEEGDHSRMPIQTYSKSNKYGLQVT